MNTFLPKEGQEDEIKELELMRSDEQEKQSQIKTVRAFHAQHQAEAAPALARLQDVARRRENVFEELMETVKSASLGQVSGALYAVGGEYRRNM